jgi:DDE superfamily endonuclease
MLLICREYLAGTLVELTESMTTSSGSHRVLHTLPSALLNVIVRFAPVCSQRTWARAQVLCMGAILAPGTRTVTAALRVMGWQEASHFSSAHRVLSRAVWSSVAASRLLLDRVGTALAPTGVRVRGLADHLERRRGERLTATGLSRDPGRSSPSHFVKARGLRWLRLLVRVPMPWAGRVWAFPVLTARCPSER